MGYEIEVFRKELFQVLKWTGGTTTQLAIYPKNAQYNERNFKWRLSTAKVEVNESVFTSLPNINRIIMIIEGKLILEHEGHHKSILNSYDKDYFSGSWMTKAFGIVTDFNLMMNEGCEGELNVIHLEKGQSCQEMINHNKRYLQYTQGYYCVKGQVKLGWSNDGIITLYEGDLVLVTIYDHMSDLKLKVYNEKESLADVIQVSIQY